MRFEVTRRDVMRFAGGAAIGAALSPMPWTLTDDLAIWTQNWRWIPRPSKGERSTATTACALCAAACPLEANCVGKSPIALRAAGGAQPLCSLGLTGHHLPWHPARITRPQRIERGAARPASVSIEAVVRETARAMAAARSGSGSVVVLDSRPDRSGSWAWQRLLASIEGAVVVATPGTEGSSLDALDALSSDATRLTTLDLAGARTILSFGAPVAEGWGRLSECCPGDVTLVQVEPMRSRSAELSDHWLPARPGTEGVLALGIANTLISASLVPSSVTESIADFAAYTDIVARFPLARVAAITGLAADDIALTARELAANGPTVVVAGEQPGGGPLRRSDRVAILGLNALLGSAGRIVDRAELLSPRAGEPLAPVARLESLPGRSVALLVIDASAGDVAFPWHVVDRKLASSALVVALSPYLAGTARHADFVVPTAPFLEAIHEIPSSRTEAAPALSISAPLLPAREGAIDPVAFVRMLASAGQIDLGGDWSSTESLARERVARIHAAAIGSVAQPSESASLPVASLASADELWDALAKGGRWTGDRAAANPERRVELAAGLGVDLTREVGAAQASDRTLKLVPRAARETTLTAVVSPVLSKLYRESQLRRSPGSATLSPRTAAALGLRNVRAARILTAGGSAHVSLSLDEGVMAGVVELTVAPDLIALGDAARADHRMAIDLLTPAADGSWSSIDAELVEG
ncbi:MAG: hypothetical protein HYU52_14810 [Acidobacteria bacterium]|nr:hypothetical protein [Acidobacteriota bacterium]